VENGGAVHGFDTTDRHGIGRFARPRVGRVIPLIAALVALGAAGCIPPRPSFIMPTPRETPVATPGVALEHELPPSSPPSASSVSGDIRFLERADGDVDLGPIVVYLRPRAAAPDSAESLRGPVVVASSGEAFAPPLAAVERGRRVVFENDGPLAHALFSADLPGARFEIPPEGRSAPFAMPAIGPVRFYCSLHAEETFVVFGGNAAHIAVVEPGEPYSFSHVASGRYTLSIWSESVSGPVRDVFVDGFSRAVEPIWIDPDLVRGARANRDDAP